MNVVYPPWATPVNPSVFDFEQSSGRLISARIAASGAIEIVRTRVVIPLPSPPPVLPPQVVAQAALGEIAGTMGAAPQAIYSELMGSYLLVARSLTAPQTDRVYRFAVTSQGVSSYLVATAPIGQPAKVASDPGGNVFMTQGQLMYRVPAERPGMGTPILVGGTPGLVVGGIEFDGSSVGTTPFVAGGQGSPAFGNFTFGGFVGSTIAPAGSGPLLPEITDLDNRSNGDVLVAMNGPGGIGGTIMLLTPAGPGAALQIYNDPASVFVRARSYTPSRTNGYSGFRGPAGALAPVLIDGANPAIGTTWNVTLTGGPANGGAFFQLGLNDVQTSAGIPLPIDFAAVGAPGSALFTSADQSLLMMLDGLGNVTYTQQIPADPTLVGLDMFAQWTVVDPAAPGGFVTSNALNVTVE